MWRSLRWHLVIAARAMHEILRCGALGLGHEGFLGGHNLVSKAQASGNGPVCADVSALRRKSWKAQRMSLLTARRP